MNKSGTGMKWFGTKTCLVALNREVFTTYPCGWVEGELKIRLNSASVGVEVEVEAEAELGN